MCVVGRRSRVRVWSAQSTQGFSGEFRPCPLTTASHSPGRGGKAGVQGSFLHPEEGGAGWPSRQRLQWAAEVLGLV